MPLSPSRGGLARPSAWSGASRAQPPVTAAAPPGGSEARGTPGASCDCGRAHGGKLGVVRGPDAPALGAPWEGHMQASCPGCWGPNGSTERELSVLEAACPPEGLGAQGLRRLGDSGPCWPFLPRGTVGPLSLVREGAANRAPCSPPTDCLG